MQFFDFNTNYDFGEFIDTIENYMNYRKEVLLKMAFNIYDFD